MVVHLTNAKNTGGFALLQKKERKVELDPRDIIEPSNSKSIKGKVSLLNEFAPAVMKGMVKTALAAVVLFGLAIVFIPLLVPLLVIGVIACFLATAIIMMEEAGQRKSS